MNIGCYVNLVWLCKIFVIYTWIDRVLLSIFLKLRYNFIRTSIYCWHECACAETGLQQFILKFDKSEYHILFGTFLTVKSLIIHLASETWWKYTDIGICATGSFLFIIRTQFEEETFCLNQIA